MWLMPWGYTSQLPDDDAKMRELGAAAVAAMEAVNGREYTLGEAGVVFPAAGGASDDYAKARARIPYSVTVELPGDDS